MIKKYFRQGLEPAVVSLLILTGALPVAAGDAQLAQVNPLMSAPAAPPAGVSAKRMAVANWFKLYDQIRRTAQMTPQEKKQSAHLSAKVMTPMASDADKAAGKALANTMIARYGKAIVAMKHLPGIPETKALQSAYLQYFTDARQVFQTCQQVQSNLLGVDHTSGQALVEVLRERKESLKSLVSDNKKLDAQLRKQYGIAPYSR